MNIKFDRIILHNFLSFGDSEVPLFGRGYCVVKGINNCKKDSAISNGSGKSSIWSGISYALTGETIQGLKSNIANIYGKDGCFVKLFFSIDADRYEITRYKDYSTVGTDLKIVVNGEDKSGKGVRESQQLLEQYLPDITTELLGSVIILGQGLPHKFSNNSPSGRKDVLEKLSKSDFMIQDLKDRIDKRTTKLNAEKRAVEDSLLSANSQLSIYNQQHTKAVEDFEKTKDIPDFDSLITQKKGELIKVESDYTNAQNKITELNTQLNVLNEQLISETGAKSQYVSEVTNKYVALNKPSVDKITELNQVIYSLTSEITKLKAITDVCPTCHQKIPGTNKPDTSEKERFLAEHKKTVQNLTGEITNKTQELNGIITKYSEDIDNRIKQIREDIVKVKSDITKTQVDATSGTAVLLNKKMTLSSEVITLENNKKNFFDNQKKLQDKVAELIETVGQLSLKVEEQTKKKQAVQQHLDVIAQMNTLVKRDFRGFLLSSVIEFIDKKAKEYAMDIFGTSELSFKLDGNNIDISYDGKTFENLSGGEKQRVDLIIQFAIRDMMSKYLSFTSNILVLDEIFDGLDILGTTNVLNLISKKLSDVESIFIISHNESLEIPYDDMITVIKDERGVSRTK